MFNEVLTHLIWWWNKNVSYLSNSGCCERFDIFSNGPSQKTQFSRYGFYTHNVGQDENNHFVFNHESGDGSIMYHSKHGWRVSLEVLSTYHIYSHLSTYHIYSHVSMYHIYSHIIAIAVHDKYNGQ